MASVGNQIPFPISLNHPASWNFDNVFTEFTLLAQQEIVDGNSLGVYGAGITMPSAATNISAVNSELQASAQGVFLFGEDSTMAQNAGMGFVAPGVNPFSGDNWLRIVDVAPVFQTEAMPLPRSLIMPR